MAAVSPDGTRIVYHVVEMAKDDFNVWYNVRHEVWVVNADGSDKRQLTADRDTDDSYRPQWSPDGTRIVYADSRGTSGS